ncbi:MAG: oligosaccharide flippase family protein [Gammaproteobacteria bacterium]
MDTTSASIFRPAIILMAGRTLAFVASFVIPIMLVRVFSQSEFGTYKQLFLIYTTLYAIAQCGMAESLFYFLPESPALAGRYVANALLGLAVAGAGCCGLLWLFAHPLGRWFHNPELGRDLPLIGVFLLFMLVSATLEIIMTAKKQHGYAFGSYAVSGIVQTLFCLVPAVLAGGLAGLLTGVIVFAALRCLLTLLYLRREYRSGLRFDGAQLKRHLAYALPFAVYVLLHTAQSNLHLYAVSSYFNAATYAIYAVGCLQIPLVDLLMTSTCNVMMVRMREEAEPAAALAIWRDATRKLAMVFIPMVAGLLTVAPLLIITLFTEKYARSVPIFMVWTFSILFPILLTDGALRVYAQTGYLIAINVIKLTIVAGCVWWFMSAFGLMGAVAATLLATLVAKVAAMMRIKRLLQCTLPQLVPWRSVGVVFVIAALAMVPAYAVQAVPGVRGVPLLAIAVLVYGLTYGALLLLWGPISKAERRMLFAWALHPAARLLQHDSP